MPEVEFDRGPVIVSGGVRGYRARVVIADGVMHIVHSPSKIDKVKLTGELTDDPARGGRGEEAWTVETEKGLVLMTTKGCRTCGYHLGKIKLSAILA